MSVRTDHPPRSFTAREIYTAEALRAVLAGPPSAFPWPAADTAAIAKLATRRVGLELFSAGRWRAWRLRRALPPEPNTKPRHPACSRTP